MDCLTLKKSNCKNCYKCIRHCPVKSIRFSGNQAYIIGNECILCGQCFVVCPQDAKQIVDETEKVKVLLQSSDPVIVSLAPSFIANYEGVGINAMREALKKLGFFDAEETAVGATIVKTEYEHMVDSDTRDIIISSCCHSINLLIQKYFPAELPYLANVLSPMQAHCKDIKRRYPNAKTVFIGPCVAKKDEAQYYEGIVDAVLTFDELTSWFKSAGVELAREIRLNGSKTPLVFVSSHTEYSLDGYEVNALRFIDKNDPNFERKFFECMDKTAYEVDNSLNAHYNIKASRKLISIPMHEIMYFEVMDHALTVHTVAGTFKERKTLAELKKDLPKQFVRIGRSHIINILQVRQLTRKQVTFGNGMKLPVAQKYSDGLFDTFLLMR